MQYLRQTRRSFSQAGVGRKPEEKVMRRRFEGIFELAKTAAQWDLDTDEGYEKFRFFALEQGIKEENLAYYPNAYQASGESEPMVFKSSLESF